MIDALRFYVIIRILGLRYFECRVTLFHFIFFDESLNFEYFTPTDDVSRYATATPFRRISAHWPSN